MIKPKCVRNGLPLCGLHSNGKFVKWPCADGYDSEARRNIYLSHFSKCVVCGDQCSQFSKRCIKCSGKINGQKRKGKKLPAWWSKRISDGQGKQEKSKFWKGENAGYWTKHKWMVKVFGNPKRCENCGLKGLKSNGVWNIHWANISQEYHRSRDDYKGLCMKCHWLFDGKTKSINDYKHGTQGKYRKGCRCELCRRFKALYRQGKLSSNAIL